MIPKHAAFTVKACLDRKAKNETLSVMDWPARSSDGNMTEAVQDHLDSEQSKRQPTSKTIP